MFPLFGCTGCFNSSLCSSQTGDRHTEGRAGNVGQADVVAELHGGGVAAMLAADAQLDVGAGLLAQVGSHLHQFANADLIQLCEGIGLVDLLVVVGAQELAGVVTAEAEGHLSQVVGAEGEELGFLGDLVSGQSGTGDLDHGADFVMEVSAGFGDQLVRSFGDHAFNVSQLLDLADQGDQRWSASQRSRGRSRPDGSHGGPSWG